MAVRRATRRWDDLGAFVKDWNGTLQAGALYLPADSVDGELAPEIRLDLMLPILGRVGPCKAQVVHRSPDGGAALQLPNLRAEAGSKIDELLGMVESVKEHLLESGVVVPATAVNDLAAEVAQLRTALAEALAAPPAAAPSAPSTQEGGVAAAAAPSRAPAPAERPAGRGFAVPALDGIDPLTHGKLEGHTLQDALVQLSVRRLTGLLTVKLDDGRVRYGFWNKGGPVGFRTDPVQDTEVLGVLLFKAGQITKEQVAESLERMKQTGQRQGEAFIDMGLMTFSQLIMVLGKQAEFVLSRLMAEEGGSWSFHELDTLPEQFLPPPVRVPSLIYRRLVQQARTMPASDLANTHRDNIDRYIKLNPELVPIVQGDIQLDANERKLVELMVGHTWRMRELFSVSPVSRQATAAILYAFVELGVIDFERTENRERYLKRVTALVTRKKRQLTNCTHFDVLESHWISLPDELKASYERLLPLYEPAQYDALPDELVEAMGYIRSRIDESYDLLRSDMQRREYRKTLIEPMMLAQSADLLAKKGEMAIMRKDRRQGTLCFAKALELVPSNGAYRDGLARARTVV